MGRANLKVFLHLPVEITGIKSVSSNGKTDGNSAKLREFQGKNASCAKHSE